MQSVLDVIIDPTGAKAGARAVNQALTSMSTTAGQATGELKARVDSMKTSIFSLQTAILGLGVAGTARSFINVGREMDLADRGLRIVTSSAGQAAVQLQRLRSIADEFQLPDKEMADAFRLLASNNIPNAEKALRSIANVAMTTGTDIGTVTTAMLAGQERMLRQLGVQMVDLGTGEVDLVFGSMEIRAKKTDDAIRAGLLKLFEKGFPDATKSMGTSVDFQLKRLGDSWDDFQQNVMAGGVNQYLATVLKTLTDGFDPDQMKDRADATAKGLQSVLETTARDIAVVVDLLDPLATASISILDRAFSAFNKLPPELQTIGIFGAFWFGKRGLVALTAGLALADKLGVKFEDIAAKTMDLAASSPLGAAITKGAELATGRERAGKRPSGLGPDDNYIGLGTVLSPDFSPPNGANYMNPLAGLSAGTKSETKSARKTLDEFLASVHADLAKTEAERKAAIANAANDRSAGGTGLRSGSGITDNDRKIMAQINKLRQDSIDLQGQEKIKQDILYSPELLQAYHDGLQTIQALEKSGLSLKAADKEAVMAIFQATGQAMQMTQAWNDALQVTNATLDRRNTLMRDSSRAAQDAQLAVDILSVPEGPARQEAELRAKLMLTIDRERIPIGSEQLAILLRQVTAITALEQRSKSLLAQEQARKDHLEKMGQLGDKLRDIEAGQQSSSFTTRLNERERAAAAQQLDFNPIEAGKQIGLEMDKERALAIEQVTYQMDQESKAAFNLAHISGMTRANREAEARVLQTVNDLRREGIDLTPEEIQGIRERSKSLQAEKEMAKSADALNQFVDSFEVGWTQIERSGEQAYSHLEDGLVRFAQTGKMNFGSLISFMESELIRFAARAAITAGFNAIGGSAGMGSFFGGLFGSAGSGTLSSTAASGAPLVLPALSGGIIPRIGYSGGGIATRPQMALFGEGSRPEAYVPLPDGKTIPVTMNGRPGGSEAPNISIAIHVGGATQQQTSANAPPNMTQLARDLSRLVEAKIIDEKRPGGLLAS